MLTARQVLDALHDRHDAAGPGAWVCVEEALSGWATAGTGGIDLLALGVWETARVGGLGDRLPRHAVVAYEVKVSRGDFRRELFGARRGHGPWPAKAAAAIEVSNCFVFATPVGLLRPWEIGRDRPWGAPVPPPAQERVAPPAPGQLFSVPAAPPPPPLSAPPAVIPAGALYVPAGCGLVEVSEAGEVVVRRQATVRREARPLTRHETHELLRRLDRDSEIRVRQRRRRRRTAEARTAEATAC